MLSKALGRLIYCTGAVQSIHDGRVLGQYRCYSSANGAIRGVKYSTAYLTISVPRQTSEPCECVSSLKMDDSDPFIVLVEWYDNRKSSVSALCTYSSMTIALSIDHRHWRNASLTFEKPQEPPCSMCASSCTMSRIIFLVSFLPFQLSSARSSAFFSVACFVDCRMPAWRSAECRSF